MKNVLTLAAAAVLAGLLSSAAHAESIPYQTTRYENGQAVRVYTNPGTAQYKRTIRGTGSSYSNPAAPPKVKRKPAPARRPVPVAAAPAGRSVAATYVARDANGYPRFVSTLDTVGRPITLDMHAEVDRLARQHNLDPLLIKALIQQESGFNPEAMSVVGAIGFMQLMPGTAEYLGVDPYDPLQNLAGGVAYLAEQMRLFGDVRLALAAYNAGPGAVLDYGGVPPYQETQNYVTVIYGNYLWSRQSR